MPTSTFTSPGAYNVSVPSNGYNIQITLRGARGGTGGTDASAQGGQGGTTSIQTFTVTQNFQARTFQLFVGARGSNGVNSQPNAAGGNGGYGFGAGGRGGNAGDPPYSGGGGGGGGASAAAVNNILIACKGGSGGGGGASDNRNGGGGGANAGIANASGSVSPTNGGQGGDPGGTDGGGGGGGGGGDDGGGGGGPGRDNSNGGGGGGAGGSSYNVSYVNSGAAFTSDGQTAMDGYASITWINAQPNIISFSASPNPQTSSNGVPSYSTTLSWNTQYADTLTLTSSAGESFNVTGQSSKTITNLPQSNANGTSPATRSYTLSATNPSGTVTSSVSVSAYNDNTPSNSWTTSFSNIAPNTTIDLTLGTLSGVDMPCTISTSGNQNFVGSGGSFSGSRNFSNGQQVKLRTTSLPYNTDVTGETGIYGKPNPKTIQINTPGGSFNVTVSTAAPRINEIFNYANNVNQYPHEDIDLVTNSPTEFLTSAQIDANDIEIPMEIKVDQPDAQISINNGSWQNARQI